LDALWIVGANPLAQAEFASQNAFVVVHELFLTETASRANVVFPAASAYEKSGTFTNTTGEIQRLKRAAQTVGTKPDLEILGLLSKEMKISLGIWHPDKVFDEIRRSVRGYNIPLPVIATGGAALTAPVNGRIPGVLRPDRIRSARDTLFTSGSLGRYSNTLNSVIEAPGGLYR
jgi:NADH-quinone oxidoreductase subunit G